MPGENKYELSYASNKGKSQKRTLVRGNRQGKVEEISRVGEVRLHGTREIELSKV
jgi:hypothetical protein